MKRLIPALLFSLSALPVFPADDLNGVSGKIFHVDLENKSFELLKETVYDPQTNEGKSRHRVYWTDDTTFTKVVTQKDFSGLNNVVVEIPVDGKLQKSPPEDQKPWQMVFMNVYPEIKKREDLNSTNIVASLLADQDNHGKGSLMMQGREVEIITSRRPRRAYNVHTTLNPTSLTSGLWTTTLTGFVYGGRFIISEMKLTPLPDPRETDDPALPRVLVVGDSISMNYHKAAKEALKGVANYHRVEGNGGPSDRGVSNMELWLGDYAQNGLHWDLIQFNHGLHDLKQKYDTETGTWGEHQVSIEDYKKNLEKEIAIMRKTGATLMWCSTTPVPQDNRGTYGRRKGEAAIYNKAALEVIRRHPDILINDLHGYISHSDGFDKWHQQNNVHFFSEDLQGLVGRKVAESVKAALATRKQPQSGSRPNIIVIMSDDMGYSDIGCYGSEINTPTLDGLAANGLRYTQFYNTGRCCPTRASLLTGLYAHQAGIGQMTSDGGVDGYRGDLSRKAVTIAEVLKTTGYRTYMSGKWHVTRHLAPEGPSHNWPIQRGFDRFYGTIIGAGSFFDPWTLCRDNTYITPENDPEYQPETYYYTDAISDNAVTYINDHAKQNADQPFFMYVSYTAAHWPMHALEKDIKKYKGHYDAGYEAIRKTRYERMKELGVIKNWPLSPAPQTWSDFPDEQKAWELRNMEVYAAMVDNMDQGIGRLVQALKKNGQFENTLILFFQDNGGCHEGRGRRPRKDLEPRPPMKKDELQTAMDPLYTRSGEPVRTGPDAMPGPASTYIAYGKNWANVSNTPFREYKSHNHEGGISTPLIAHWPKGIKAKNELRQQPGHLIDIMATCVDLAGATYPAEFNGNPIPPMEGRSLAISFDDDVNYDRLLMWEHYSKAAIRVGNWKLVRLHPNRGKWELYDIEKDRSEMNDLSQTMPEKAKELEDLWEFHAHRTMIYPKPAYRSKKKKK